MQTASRFHPHVIAHVEKPDTFLADGMSHVKVVAHGIRGGQAGATRLAKMYPTELGS
jgi:hypothetical protein